MAEGRDGAFEVDVVFPEGVVGVDEKGLAGGERGHVFDGTKRKLLASSFQPGFEEQEFVGMAVRIRSPLWGLNLFLVALPKASPWAIFCGPRGEVQMPSSVRMALAMASAWWRIIGSDSASIMTLANASVPL